MSYKDILKKWDEFFFAPRPVEGMAVFRIFWFGLLIAYYLLDWVKLMDFYGPFGIVSLDTVRSQFNYPHMNILMLTQQGEGTIQFFYALYGVALLAGFLGFKTRWATVISFVLMTSFHQRNIWLMSSSEVVMRLVTMLCIFAPIGNAYSIDSWLGRKYPLFKQEKVAPLWAWRLIQIQLCVIYVWTCWHKMKGETWFDGTAVYYATRLEDLTRFPVPWLLDQMWVIKFLTWATLILEFALGTFIWVKELRIPLVISGIIFHLGIEYMMSISFFELVMIVLLLVFILPEEWKKIMDKLDQKLVSEMDKTNFGEPFKVKFKKFILG